MREKIRWTGTNLCRGVRVAWEPGVGVHPKGKEGKERLPRGIAVIYVTSAGLGRTTNFKGAHNMEKEFNKD